MDNSKQLNELEFCDIQEILRLSRMLKRQIRLLKKVNITTKQRELISDVCKNLQSSIATYLKGGDAQ